MKWLRRLIALALLASFAYLSYQLPQHNDVLVNVDLLLWQWQAVPLWLALGAAFAAGVLCASAGLLYQLAKKSLVARRYRRAMAGLESEVHQLRNLPLAGSEGPGAAEDPAVSGAP